MIICFYSKKKHFLSAACNSGRCICIRFSVFASRATIRLWRRISVHVCQQALTNVCMRVLCNVHVCLFIYFYFFTTSIDRYLRPNRLVRGFLFLFFDSPLSYDTRYMVCDLSVRTRSVGVLQNWTPYGRCRHRRRHRSYTRVHVAKLRLFHLCTLKIYTECIVLILLLYVSMHLLILCFYHRFIVTLRVNFIMRFTGKHAVIHDVVYDASRRSGPNFSFFFSIRG